MGKRLTVVKTNIGDTENFTPSQQAKRFFAEKLGAWCPPDSKYRKIFDAILEDGEKK
jgi:hypothetical protein